MTVYGKENDIAVPRKLMNPLLHAPQSGPASATPQPPEIQHHHLAFTGSPSVTC